MKNKTQHTYQLKGDSCSEQEKRYIGVDGHPDLVTLAVMSGESPSELRLIKMRDQLPIAQLENWVRSNVNAQRDCFLLEASANTFGIAQLLDNLGYQFKVLDSVSISKQADWHTDSDKMAAQRIVRAWLSGNAKEVWSPDPITRSYRELLSLYLTTVTDHARCINRLKSYLNQHLIRIGKTKLKVIKEQEKLYTLRHWNETELIILNNFIEELAHTQQRREKLYALICKEVFTNPAMLICMRILGIGVINAFALVSVIGDIRRFKTSRHLCSYLGVNPSQKKSGMGKHITIGIGHRGRRDARSLLTQAAQQVFLLPRESELRSWAMKLFMRKGNRNIVIMAVARRLTVYIWHALNGREIRETEKQVVTAGKMAKLVEGLGTDYIRNLGYKSYKNTMIRLATFLRKYNLPSDYWSNSEQRKLVLPAA